MGQNASSDSECCVVLETSKERFLVVRHEKKLQSEGPNADGVNDVASDKPTFTISLIQGEVEIKDAPTSTVIVAMKSDNLTPVIEGPKSSLQILEQPTKEPSPVAPLLPVSTPQEVKDSERGRTSSVVDVKLDTPVSVTAGSDISSSTKKLSSGGEPGQDPALRNMKPTGLCDASQPDDESMPTNNISPKVEAAPSPSPALVMNSETTAPEVLPTTSTDSAPRPEGQGISLVQLKLQILQRNIRREDLVFGDDGLGILSADMDPSDNSKKGWLIEAPRWRMYNGRMSDCIVVD